MKKQLATLALCAALLFPCAAPAAALAFCPDEPFHRALEATHFARALALALPAWAAWPILKIREKRNHAAR